MKRQERDGQRVNKHQTETTKVKQGYKLQASCGTEPLHSQMKTPGEAKGIVEYKGDHPGKRSRPTVVLHTYKKCNREGGGWGTHVKKSSPTKCE